ncbi:hypothetical protein E3N88_01571 [Mikania micrantha]|uniref:Uncharacterized protein n=1 Tax=Mikania micrantha TaxID=192012 RepID=A0A5N6Q1B8_9ASTR|nr:hypothetical protein E3N88_01571 [Mikania micrantha]
MATEMGSKAALAVVGWKGSSGGTSGGSSSMVGRHLIDMQGKCVHVHQRCCVAPTSATTTSATTMGVRLFQAACGIWFGCSSSEGSPGCLSSIPGESQSKGKDPVCKANTNRPRQGHRRLRKRAETPRPVPAQYTQPNQDMKKATLLRQGNKDQLS